MKVKCMFGVTSRVEGDRPAKGGWCKFESGTCGLCSTVIQISFKYGCSAESQHFAVFPTTTHHPNDGFIHAYWLVIVNVMSQTRGCIVLGEHRHGCVSSRPRSAPGQWSQH